MSLTKLNTLGFLMHVKLSHCILVFICAAVSIGNNLSQRQLMCVSMMTALAENGADVNFQNNVGKTA